MFHKIALNQEFSNAKVKWVAGINRRRESAAFPGWTEQIVCEGHLFPTRSFAERNVPGYRCYNCTLYFKGVGAPLAFCKSQIIFARTCTTSYWRKESLSSSITWSSVNSPGQIRKFSSIPSRVQRWWGRALQVSPGIPRSIIFSMFLFNFMVAFLQLIYN